jgi:ABC-type polysaccharide/polyol phosphate export permease
MQVAAAGRRNPIADLVELASYGQVLTELVKRDIKLRYKRSVLGLIWTMLNPLLVMGVTTLIFSDVFKSSIDHFPIYLLSAWLAWNLFLQGTNVGCTSIVGVGALMRRIYVPPALFPLASVGSAVVNLLFSLIPLAALMLLTGGTLSWALLFLPVAIVLAAIFTYGVALLLATVTVFFQDTVHLYQAVVMLLMYMTPLFYPIEIVPDEFLFIVTANPIFHFVTLFRDPIYAGTLPAPEHIWIALAYAVGALTLAWWYHERSRDTFASYL